MDCDVITKFYVVSLGENMQKIKLVTVGKLKEKYLEDAMEEYTII